MKVKKYVGKTAHEAMNRMKTELGSDAVILNTRTVREKGIIGLFKKPVVEVTAAYEEKDLLSFKKTRDDKFTKINNELSTLKVMMEEISANVVDKDSKLPIGVEKYRNKLVENGVEYCTATSILKDLSEQVNLTNKDDEVIRNIIKYTLMEYIGDVRPLRLDNEYQKIVFFIGPTGVGKTTTLAKIAARLVMEKKYDIGLITSDTYRIAAVDQLKTYSDILKLPLEIVYNQEDMYKTLASFREKNIVFVDTAGKNHKEIDEEDEIYKIMRSINNKEIYLVLSGTTDYYTLSSIIKHYNFIENYKIIFTKIDEAEGFGNIINIKYLTKNPVSYVTTGQNVPDDIEILDKYKVASWLIGENIDERSS